MLRKFPDVKRISDLKLDTKYMITALKQLNSKFGVKIVAEILDEGTIYSVYLPARIVKAFEDDGNLMSKLHTYISWKKLYFIYKGGPYNNLEFIME